MNVYQIKIVLTDENETVIDRKECDRIHDLLERVLEKEWRRSFVVGVQILGGTLGDEKDD